MYLNHFLIYMIQNTSETSILFSLGTPKGGIQIVIFCYAFSSESISKIISRLEREEKTVILVL